jgi:carboxymethylenebutenolidase
MLTGLSAAAPYYGGGMTTESEIARQPKVPVLAHFAEDDKWIPLDTVEAFKKAHPEVALHTYAAHHGFNCDQRGAWHAPSAQLARERTLAFFAKHLA